MLINSNICTAATPAPKAAPKTETSAAGDNAAEVLQGCHSLVSK